MFLTDLFSFRWPGGYIYTSYHQDHIENINLFITFSLYVCLKLQYRHTHQKYIFSLSWLQPMSVVLYIHNDLSVSTKHSYKMWWYIKYTHVRHFDTHKSLLWNVMAYQPFLYIRLYIFCIWQWQETISLVGKRDELLGWEYSWYLCYAFEWQ